MRLYLLRLPIFRAIPRITAPLLPIASRLRAISPTAASFPQRRFFQNFPARLASSPPPSPSTPLLPNATLSQRLRHLFRTYGWYALGVYTILTILDFGVAFAGVNILGAEQAEQLASAVKGMVMRFWPSGPSDPGEKHPDNPADPTVRGHEGLWAMLILAYTIHKTIFLPVRVGLTAVVTPRLVRWLGRRGWTGTDGARRAATEVQQRIRNSRSSTPHPR
jgi:N-terminal acetyltransferase 2